MKTIINSSIKFFLNFLLVGFLIQSAYAQIPTEIPGVESALKMSSDLNGLPILNSGDQTGTSVARIGDLNNDGNEDIAIGRPGFDTVGGGNNNGAIFICLMLADGTPDTCIQIDATDTVFHNDIENGDLFGWSICGIGDLNGDGFEDIIVGSPGHTESATDDGAIRVIFLDTVGVVRAISQKKISHGVNGFPNTELASQDQFGYSVTALGDIDGDSIQDIAVGAANYNVSAARRGAVFVIPLNTDGTAKTSATKKITTSSGGFTGTLDASDAFGFSVSGTGDLNGDGVNDLAVGATSDDDGLSGAGAVWILYLESDGEVDTLRKLSLPLRSKIFDYYTDYNFGSAVTATDINSDGYQDLYVGASGTGGSVIYAITLDSVQNPHGVRKIGPSNASWNTSAGGTAFGRSICVVQDLGSDGHPEVFVGQPSDNSNRGAVHILTQDSLTYNITEGMVGDMSMIGDISGSFSATLADDQFGVSVTRLCDVNGDGIDDVAVGAFQDDQGGASSNRGAIYILFLDTMSNVSSFTKIGDGLNNGPTLAANDQFGSSVYGPGDLDGDNVPDVYVGAPGDDDGGANSNRGAVHRLLLNSDGTVKAKSKISTNNGLLGAISNGGGFGISITGIGDINGDGVNDLAVGAYLDTSGGTNRGAVWILKMKNDDSVMIKSKISDTQGNFTETFNDGARFGISVGNIGDFGGDTVPDLLVGAPVMNTTGAAYILYLDTFATVDSFVKINYTSGNFPETLENNGFFGRSIINAGDMDLNGTNDLLIGQIDYTSYGTSKGAIWLAFLDSLGNVLRAQNISESGGWCYANPNTDDDFGVSLANYGLDSSSLLQKFFVGSNTRDEGGSNRGVIFMVGLTQYATLSRGPKYNAYYAELYRELSGSHYFLSGDRKLKFRVDGEYMTHELNWKIYTNSFTEVYNNNVAGNYWTNVTTGSQDEMIGENYFSIDVGCDGYTLAGGYYVLEVINEKNESRFLRFYVTPNNCVITPTGPNSSSPK